MKDTINNPPRPIIVLGAGVIGLTTAIRLLESTIHTISGHPVHIIAAHLPSDQHDPMYASGAAGAHHLSFADNTDERQRGWDRRTFQIMYDEIKRLGPASGLMQITQTEFYDGKEKHLQILEEHPNFIVHDPKTLPSFATHSVSFTSLTMTPSIYLERLVARFHELTTVQYPGGVFLHRRHLNSLTDLSDPSVATLFTPEPQNSSPVTPLAVIPCVGIGALSLGGIEDKTVFPTRGQVMRILAPQIKTGWTRQVGSLSGGEGGERTYIIPRCNGEVILGGTREVRDWYPYPREETAKSIWRRAKEICKNVSEMDDDQLKLQADGGSVIGHVVGFRPSRAAGIRLERGPDLQLKLGAQSKKASPKTVVVYNYGHGGAGWQSSWGCAEDVVRVLNTALGSRGQGYKL